MRRELGTIQNLEYTPNGIPYEWGLAGSEGAWFDLHPVRGKHSASDVKIAKAHLRNAQDVVRLTVIWRTALLKGSESAHA